MADGMDVHEMVKTGRDSGDGMRRQDATENKTTKTDIPPRDQDDEMVETRCDAGCDAPMRQRQIARCDVA